MIKAPDIGGLDVKTAGLRFNPANEIHSNIFHLCPLLSDQPLWISTCRPCPIRFSHDGDLFTAVFSVKRECLMTILFCLLFSSQCFPFTAFCPLFTAYSSLPGALHQLFTAFCFLTTAFCLLPSAFLLGGPSGNCYKIKFLV